MTHPDSNQIKQDQCICLICQSPIDETDHKAHCPSCQKPYHKDCWDQNKGCAVYGCPQVPPTETLSELEVPVSYWGKEKKNCPLCKKEILAAALRCTHCGSIFSSARPQSPEKYEQEEVIKAMTKSLKRQAILIFSLNIFTFTAPFGVVAGFFWFRSKARAIEKLPSFYEPLSKIGIATGIIQTLLLTVLAVFYTIFN